MYRTIKHNLALLGVLALGLVLASPAAGQDKTGLVERAQARRAKAAPINPRLSVLDVHNMTTWLQNDGFFPWEDPFSGVNGTVPKRIAGSVFAQGVVWGGTVRDGKSPAVRVNGSTYATGLDAGRILTDAAGNVIGPDDNSDLSKYHVWRVRRDWQTLDYNQAASYFFGVPLGDVTDAQRQQVREQYEYDWNNWPAEMGAPFEDVDGNGSYDPNVDIPGRPGATQTLWIVANDLRQGTSERSYGSPAIGIEYQLTLWGYDFPSTSPLGNIHFAQARLIYKGTPTTPSDARIDSMYVVQWVDPDVGDAGDDFAAADTSLSLGYAYNASTQDAAYRPFGVAPPAIGWDFLQGPINAEGDTLGMTSFVYFAAGSDISDPDLGDYPGTLQWYNLMRGMRPRPEYPAGEPFINPLTDESSNFTLTGDPVTGSGWIDGLQLPPGDRRTVQASGPFSMELGDTVNVVIGQIAGIGSNNLSSVTVLRYYDLFAQFAYDNNFQLPSPPPTPAVEVAELDEKLLIDWGSDVAAADQVESSESRGFEFEGYNVYQLPSETASLSEGVKIASFDKVNLVSTIFDQVIDEETGFVVSRPVQVSSNEGLQRFLVVEEDAIRNRPLSNGVRYYYAVTSYSYYQGDDEDVPFRMLESTPNVVVATPHEAQPGDEEAIDPNTEVEVAHTGPATSTVEVEVVNPARVQNGNYEVRFEYFNPYTGETQPTLAEGDTLREVPAGLYEATQFSADRRIGPGDPFPTRWALFRDGQRVSDWHVQIDPRGDVPRTAAPIIEGLQVYVPFVASGEFTVQMDGEPWIDGVNWGGQIGLHGGLDVGANFFGSTVPPEELNSVEVVFQGDNTSGPVDGWASEGAVYPRAEGYTYDTIGKLPLAAYEIAGGERRQVNVSFVELDNAACGNDVWDLGALTDNPDCMGLGGREYIFIHKSDYDGGQTYVGNDDAIASDVSFAFWPELVGDYLENPFTMTILVTKSNAPEDRFTFDVEAPATDDPALAREAIEEINVFPNPYMGFNQLETNRFEKFVTFTHLPEQATIRIFSLSGTMVRVIEHDSPSQFERWDLTNADEIPVASGIYIAHIETEFGEKVLKLALVQEEQILDRY